MTFSFLQVKLDNWLLKWEFTEEHSHSVHVNDWKEWFPNYYFAHILWEKSIEGGEKRERDRKNKRRTREVQSETTSTWRSDIKPSKNTNNSKALLNCNNIFFLFLILPLISHILCGWWTQTFQRKGLHAQPLYCSVLQSVVVNQINTLHVFLKSLGSLELGEKMLI